MQHAAMIAGVQEGFARGPPKPFSCSIWGPMFGLRMYVGCWRKKEGLELAVTHIFAGAASQKSAQPQSVEQVLDVLSVPVATKLCVAPGYRAHVEEVRGEKKIHYRIPWMETGTSPALIHGAHKPIRLAASRQRFTAHTCVGACTHLAHLSPSVPRWCVAHHLSSPCRMPALCPRSPSGGRKPATPPWGSPCWNHGITVGMIWEWCLSGCRPLRGSMLTTPMMVVMCEAQPTRGGLPAHLN